MKLKHTQKKSANRSFNNNQTGFLNERDRKGYMESISTRKKNPDAGSSNRTKAKRPRKSIKRTVYPKH